MGGEDVIIWDAEGGRAGHSGAWRRGVCMSLARGWCDSGQEDRSADDRWQWRETCPDLPLSARARLL